MKRNIGDNIEFGSVDEMMSYYVDIYAAMFYSRDNWLTDKEKLFFLEHVKLYNKKYNLVSKNTVDYLQSVFNNTKSKDRSVWIYRGKLKKKGWLIQTPKGLIIPQAFIGSFKELSVKLNIKHV